MMKRSTALAGFLIASNADLSKVIAGDATEDGYDIKSVLGEK